MVSASEVGDASSSWKTSLRPRESHRLSRALRIFADIRADEAIAALLLTANGFVLLLSYYILKTVREPLILQGRWTILSGSELKAYATAVQAVLLIGLLPLYSLVASRVHRARLIHGTVGGLVLSLLVFYGLGRAGVAIGIAYYLWLGIAGLVVIAQFWSLANDTFSHHQGERLFPFIAVGGTLGAIAGAALTGVLIDSLGILSMLLIAAAGLAVYSGIYLGIERSLSSELMRRARRPVGGRGGFELVRKNRYLLLIGAVVLIANLVNTHGEYILATAVNQLAESEAPAAGATPSEAVLEARREVVGEIYAGFYGAVNVLALLLQIFVVSRVFRYLGVHRALFIFPLFVAGAYLAILAVPVFALIRAAKIAENSVDYSLNNTVRQTLFLPTGRDAKYKAKAAIDTLFQRGGDLLAGGTVFLGLHVFSMSLRHFAFANLLLVGAWLAIATYLSRRYRQLEHARRHQPHRQQRGRFREQRRAGRRWCYGPGLRLASSTSASTRTWANR